MKSKILSLKDFPEEIQKGFINKPLSAETIFKRIEKSFINGELSVDLFEVSINTLEPLIKGGKRAQIGEIRTFGGRRYIKTVDGWKFFGKGTGKKAQSYLPKKPEFLKGNAEEEKIRSKYQSEYKSLKQKRNKFMKILAEKEVPVEQSLRDLSAVIKKTTRVLSNAYELSKGRDEYTVPLDKYEKEPSYDAYIEKVVPSKEDRDLVKDLYINAHGDTGYRNLNSFLRDGTFDSSEELDGAEVGRRLKQNAKVLEESLDKHPKYVGVVRRDIFVPNFAMKDFLDKYEVGSEVEFKTFLSSTKDSMGISFFRGNVQYSIMSKTGRDLNVNNGEEEVLFKPNTKFAVLERTEINTYEIPYLDEKVQLITLVEV